jgi:hypothetical protein
MEQTEHQDLLEATAQLVHKVLPVLPEQTEPQF